MARSSLLWAERLRRDSWAHNVETHNELAPLHRRLMDDVRVPPAGAERVPGRMRKKLENISVAGALPQHAVHQITMRTTRSMWGEA